jgi:hypothetical protein
MMCLIGRQWGLLVQSCGAATAGVGTTLILPRKAADRLRQRSQHALRIQPITPTDHR